MTRFYMFNKLCKLKQMFHKIYFSTNYFITNLNREFEYLKEA